MCGREDVGQFIEGGSAAIATIADASPRDLDEVLAEMVPPSSALRFIAGLAIMLRQEMLSAKAKERSS